ncbi:LysM peptidoglycan-binding domain-containing protein [Alkalihalobacillus sp. MEB130]|uniref:LysM peptidoglycan-binding and 3D domain-containing protein n=1 Tax=Alkalihalobacillus sp. MEB130 TaxID=2976704 RepID=UPI0028DEBAC7|nr:LysM peptidoglycan-binding domain-containing protein [Alkalihalobacillus sp. MEB130]MDT8859748.1 LysM peptidoglycan-binding domain-containing protein [Alkalihalobacillus sp. MEB130]
MRKNIVSLVTVAALLGSLGFGMSASAEEVTVHRGDTLWSIASINNIQVNDLKEWNQLSSNLIFPGDTLQVSQSGNAQVKTRESANNAEQYTIKKGDTLSSIARQYNVSVSSLQEWNQISNPNVIVTGDTLSINGQSTARNNTNKQDSQEAPSTKEVVAQELTMTATAYTASCNGCTGITATGLNLLDNPDKKVISVDPSVIPLGTEVYVEGYGHAVAADTGGAIKGNKIDLFIPNRQDALNWGVQEVNVKILN